MSIWAKLTGANTAFQSDEKSHGTNYFYSSNAGQIISADGSGYVLPNLDKLPSQKEEFIPQKEALSKIQELITVSETNQKQYQENIAKLDTYYKNLLENSKSHYEKVIQDLRSKAKRHVEIQKTMKKQREDELSKELKQNEEIIDEMRDSMANLNRKYQDEVRALKKQLLDTETLLERKKTGQEENERYFNSRFALSEMISKMENDYFNERIAAMDSTFKSEKRRLQNEFEHELFNHRTQFDSWKSSREKEIASRKECEACLLSIVMKLELEELFQTEKKQQDLELLVHELESTKERLLDEAENQKNLLNNLNSSQDNLLTENAAKQEEIAQLLYDFALEKEQILKHHKEEVLYHKTNFEKQLSSKQESVDRLEVEKTMLEMIETLHEWENKAAKVEFEGTLRKLKLEASLNDSQAGQLLEEVRKEFETQQLAASQQNSTELDKLKIDLIEEKKRELAQLHEKHSVQMQEISSQYDSKLVALQNSYAEKLEELSGKYERVEIELTLENMKYSLLERESQLLANRVVSVAPKSDVETMTDSNSGTDVGVDTIDLSLKAAVVENGNVDVGVATVSVEVQDATVNTETVETPNVPVASSQEQSALLGEINLLKVQLEDAKQQIAQLTKSSNQNIVETPADSGAAPSGGGDGEKVLPTPQINPQLVAIMREVSEIEELLNQQKQEQAQCKQDIKDWTRDFQAANNRAPEVSDKALIRDKYQRYKDITTAIKSSEAKLKDLLQRKDDAEKNPPTIVKEESSHLPPSQQSEANAISVSKKSKSEVVQPVVADVSLLKEKVDAEVQVELAPSVIEVAAPVPVNEPVKEEPKGPTIEEIQQQHAVEIENLTEKHQVAIEQLEDVVFTLQEESKITKKQLETLDADKKFLEVQLEALIKEKRTDIINRYEEDLKLLKQKESDLNEKLTLLMTEKTKNESKINELKDRAEKAEQELRERDAREMKAINPQEESYRLKGEINKQRDQIILKAKAATAGWDAAANADEKLELEAQKAYMKGIREEKERHAKDLVAVNASLEMKETRITELLVQMAEMEKKVKQSDIEQENMRSQMEAMKLEVADAIAGIQNMAAATGGGGSISNADGEVVIPPSSAEFEHLREQLDTAQDEVVQLSERCERIEGELELARKRNRLYERLATMTGLTSGVAAPVGSGGSGAKGDYGKYNLDEAISNAKKAIVKGTNLWKSNRKDDCYDVYLDSCVDVLNKVLTEELVKPVRDSIEHGKTQGAQNKQRGAVVFRKALDKFLADAGQPNLKKAEEDAVAAGRAKVEASNASQNAANNTIVSSLMMQLTNMDNMFLEQGYTAEKNPANSSSAGTAERTPREGGADSQNASSLLQRAKEAELKVKSLQKQLAAVISASSASISQRQDTVQQVSAEGESGEGATANAKSIKIVNSGADPAEVRRLNRKIKDLELQLKNAASAGSGGSGGDSKATQQIEKQLNKKIKDLEAQLKKETKTLEQRAVKAENALNKVESNQKSIVIERDQLKSENAKLFAITSEMNVLKEKAEQFEEISAKLTVKEQEYQLLSEQFKKETQLRKKYKNELEDLKGAIRVYARCRPMARYELEKGCKTVVEILSESSLKVTTGRGEKEFEFDCVFGPRSTQDEIFEDTKRLVESCLDGFNVCVFAYGQTGSGKTFTMTGSPSLPGLTPKAINELFDLMEDRKHLQIKVTTYFVELYNDNLVDLYWILDNKKTQGADAPPKLEIKMDNKKMVFIRNCVIKEVSSPYELMELFEKGNAERHTGATKMNAESSRSHSIFSVLVESLDTTTKRTTFGKLSLVDLAGSERADKTGASAERLREAQSINKSLSALGDVIAALSEGGSNKFIPYRNNKLTQLMQDSLGGNAKTLMFVNFSPADYNADETSTSLMYASRVKKIVNNASKQAESEEVARLKAIIKRLQAGQSIADLEPQEPVVEAEEPVAEDDGKVYDGY